MSFKLKSVVAWGRNADEYINMFNITSADMECKIAGFGDGPSSFNAEMTAKGADVTSYDPIYAFSAEDIKDRIEDTRNIVMEQMSQNMDNYVWTNFKGLSDLENTRISAMNNFLLDFEKGKKEGRYVAHSLPDSIDLPDKYYDIGLSSHFLLMYTDLGYDFHIRAIDEMLRLCREVRIFPVCDLDGRDSKLIKDVIEYFDREHIVDISETKYEFQKAANKVLKITDRNAANKN